METFCLPWHEIEERFTRSELFMTAWRSQEQHHQLMEKMNKWDKDKGKKQSSQSSNHYGSSDIVPEGLPEHFYNAEGEVDLSQVTGKEAYKYMSSIGMKFPVMRTNKPNPSFSQ